ncbi:MAG: hypothetical protein ACAI44_04215 [Candidatus Sericytochromatia bacterium]
MNSEQLMKASFRFSRDVKDFLGSMERVLRLLSQPVALRKLDSASVLLLGPYAIPGKPGSGHCLSICMRHEMEQALALTPSGRSSLDFHIRCPFTVAAGQADEVAWLLDSLNLYLPLGCFQFRCNQLQGEQLQGRPLYQYELPLQQNELPVSLFLETVAIVIDCYSQSAPLLEAVAKGELLASDVGAWLCTQGIRPGPLEQIFMSRSVPRRRSA